MLLTLNKIFVAQFYRVNASLFFLVIAFAGGFMRSHDHIALGEFFIASPIFFLIPLAIWLIYAFLIISFNSGVLRRKENSFISSMILLNRTRQYLLCATIITNQLIPAIFYGFFLMVLALKQGLTTPLYAIPTALGVIVLLCTHILRISAIQPQDDTRTSIFIQRFKRTAKPYLLMLFQTVLSARFLMLAGYKIFSMVVLWSALYLYETDSYDMRLLGLAATISYSLGISFVIEWHTAENRILTLYRRMPLSNLKRLGYILAVIVIYTIPEAFVIAQNFPADLSPADGWISILYGISVYFMWYCFQYVKERKTETIMSFVSVTAIVWFLLILTHIPLVVIIAVNLAAGLLCFLIYYDRFEYQG